MGAGIVAALRLRCLSPGAERHHLQLSACRLLNYLHGGTLIGMFCVGFRVFGLKFLDGEAFKDPRVYRVCQEVFGPVL